MIKKIEKTLYYKHKKRSTSAHRLMLACSALFMGMLGFSTPSFAQFVIPWDDWGVGEPCPVPHPCLKTQNLVSQQDNGYHNTLQAMHGSKEKTINVYEDTPETATTDPHYTTTAPPQYMGLPPITR